MIITVNMKHNARPKITFSPTRHLTFRINKTAIKAPQYNLDFIECLMGNKLLNSPEKSISRVLKL